MGLLTLDGKYVTVGDCRINIEQAKTIDTKTDIVTVTPGLYNVMVDYNVYASQKAYLNKKKPLEVKFINCITPADKLSGINIHQIVYDKLKEVLPGSTDL
jgi:hypothetical protein